MRSFTQASGLAQRFGKLPALSVWAYYSMLSLSSYNLQKRRRVVGVHVAYFRRVVTAVGRELEARKMHRCAVEVLHKRNVSVVVDLHRNRSRLSA